MSYKICAEEFFLEKLNANIPALAEVKSIYESRGIEAAETAFADYIRTSGALRADLFFKGQDTAPTDEDIALGEKIINGWLTSVGVSMQFPDRKVDWSANPTYNNYKEWTVQLARHAEWERLGFLYRHTSDERYTRAFEDYFLSFYSGAEPPSPDTSGFDTLSWRTLEAGIRLERSWCYAIMAFYKSPALSAHTLTLFFMSVYDNVRRILNASTANNWLITELSGISTAALAFPFFAESEGWEKYAQKRLTDELSMQVYPDHFQYELTTGYQMVIIDTYIGILKMHEKFEAEVPKELRSSVADLFRLYIQLMLPNGYAPGTNDAYSLNAVKACRKACEVFPELYDDFSFIAYGVGKEPPFKSITMEYSGFGVLRSGWGADDACAILESAPFGKAHQHEDKLQLILHAYRKNLLVDMGTYAYDRSAMRAYIISSYSHNVALVDGNGQNRRAHYSWNPESIRQKADIAYCHGDEVEWVEGVYNEGFGTDNIAVIHKRRLIWYKQGKDFIKEPFYAVIDRFIPEDGRAHDYTLLWHLAPDTNPITSVNSITADYGDGVKFNLIGMTEPKILSGQKEPIYIGWKPVHAPGEHKHTPIPTVTYTYRGKETTVATLLYPTTSECKIGAVSVDGNGEISLTPLKN